MARNTSYRIKRNGRGEEAINWSISLARIFDWGGANHKSHAMQSSEIFDRGTFCGTKIS